MQLNESSANFKQLLKEGTTESSSLIKTTESNDATERKSKR
jgi:hypothetical protein